MSGSSHHADSGNHDPSTMPFVAPCKQLGKTAPWRWFRMG
jgi:hypothetical protein